MNEKLDLNDLRELNEKTGFERIQKIEQLIYLNDLRIEQTGFEHIQNIETTFIHQKDNLIIERKTGFERIQKIEQLIYLNTN